MPARSAAGGRRRSPGRELLPGSRRGPPRQIRSQHDRLPIHSVHRAHWKSWRGAANWRQSISSGWRSALAETASQTAKNQAPVVFQPTEPAFGTHASRAIATPHRPPPTTMCWLDGGPHRTAILDGRWCGGSHDGCQYSARALPAGDCRLRAGEVSCVVTHPGAQGSRRPSRTLGRRPA